LHQLSFKGRKLTEHVQNRRGEFLAVLEGTQYSSYKRSVKDGLESTKMGREVQLLGKNFPRLFQAFGYLGTTQRTTANRICQQISVLN